MAMGVSSTAQNNSFKQFCTSPIWSSHSSRRRFSSSYRSVFVVTHSRPLQRQEICSIQSACCTYRNVTMFSSSTWFQHSCYHVMSSLETPERWKLVTNPSTKSARMVPRHIVNNQHKIDEAVMQYSRNSAGTKVYERRANASKPNIYGTEKAWEQETKMLRKTKEHMQGKWEHLPDSICVSDKTSAPSNIQSIGPPYKYNDRKELSPENGTRRHIVPCTEVKPRHKNNEVVKELNGVTQQTCLSSKDTITNARSIGSSPKKISEYYKQTSINVNGDRDADINLGYRSSKKSAASFVDKDEAKIATEAKGLSQDELHEKLSSIYSKVLIVDNVSAAKEVVGLLIGQYRNLVHACDTEVAKIDVKQETPVNHGELICFSIYSGPQADFGNGKSCIWVDVLDGGGRDLLVEFAPFFEDPSIRKVWHNYSFDNHIIENYGFKVSGFHADTMHMARLWDSSRRTEGGYSLEALTSDKRVLSGTTLGKEAELFGKISMKTIFGRKKLKKDGSEGKIVAIAPVEELQRQERKSWIGYSALDAISTFKLYESLKSKLSRKSWSLDGKPVSGKSMFDFYKEYWQPFGPTIGFLRQISDTLNSFHFDHGSVIMAEAVLFQLSAELFRKLDSHVVQHIALWWGAKDELQQLKDTISTIKMVLLDAEKQQSQSTLVRVWLGRLKDAMYDADDLLDDFSTEALQRQLMISTGNGMVRQVRLFFSGSNQFAYGFKVDRKIKAIRKRLDAIAKERVSFHLLKGPVEEEYYMRGDRKAHAFVGGEHVIGREEDKKKIIGILLDSKENILVLPIVGIGGLGKTALAQIVYNDEKVKQSFDLRMWVSVSDPFDVKLIVEKIMKSATNEDLENLALDQLHKLLQKKIDEKKYLLVLDDVWNEDRNKWLYLESLLGAGRKGSRIIVTTRSEKVAQVFSDVKPHVLKGLSSDDAWTLFKGLAFREGEEPTDEGVVDIGKKIVSKCAGVPLAIRTIGASLYYKDPKEWSVFEKKESSLTTQQEGDILSTLRLSYDSLPSHLKNCFAYCRLFPKKCEIYVPKLIYFWMAQGFIQVQNDNQSCLEDIGLEYFKELTWRSFFQEVKKDEWGNIMYCKMHDLMHNLAISVGGTESIMLTSNDKCLDEKTRHVSFDFKIDLSWQIPTSFLKKNVIRAFLMPNQESWEIDGECLTKARCNSIVLNSKCLRTLEFHCLNLVTLPNSIGKLKCLRYLDLSENSKLEALPSSVTKLQNLQVLKLLDCYKLKRLPHKIKKLVSLQCLQIWGCDQLAYMPRGIGHLSFLHRLDRFIVDTRGALNWKSGAGLNELNGLNKLRGKLCIENLGYLKHGAEQCRAANLKEKKHLQWLQLQWNGNGDGDCDIVDQEK